MKLTLAAILLLGIATTAFGSRFEGKITLDEEVCKLITEDLTVDNYNWEKPLWKTLGIDRNGPKSLFIKGDNVGYNDVLKSAKRLEAILKPLNAMKAGEVYEMQLLKKELNELQVQVANFVYPDLKDPERAARAEEISSMYAYLGHMLDGVAEEEFQVQAMRHKVFAVDSDLTRMETVGQTITPEVQETIVEHIKDLVDHIHNLHEFSFNLQATVVDGLNAISVKLFTKLNGAMANKKNVPSVLKELMSKIGRLQTVDMVPWETKLAIETQHRADNLYAHIAKVFCAKQ